MTEAPQRRVIGLDEQEDRYHRQSLITWWDQHRLRDAKVLVVGAGALGNELVKNLVLMGVGHIVVVDMDSVENSNLARCVFFRERDEGRPKAEVLAEHARELNSEVEVVPIVGDVRLTVGLGVFAEMDVVLGGLDNREARLFVNQACWKTSTPWVDGAIEGLMGLVRVFVPPHGPCYECTLSEEDHRLMSLRRTCTMLSREELLAGKTPTTATSSSVVAGIQAQEAVKLIHCDRLGEPALSGAAFQFVGLTHDSYVVRYRQREDCMSHDTYLLAGEPLQDPGSSLRELLGWAHEQLGPEAILELEHELVIGASCSSCGASSDLVSPLDALGSGAGLCSSCGREWQLAYTHTIDAQSPLLDRTAREIGLPQSDVMVARAGLERRFIRLAADAQSATPAQAVEP